MSRYNTYFDKNARKQMKQMKTSGRKADVERVNRFIGEIMEHPRAGTGHPKPLTGEEGEVWSRKVNEKDRFVYRIFEEQKKVLVTRVLGHYGDR